SLHPPSDASDASLHPPSDASLHPPSDASARLRRLDDARIRRRRCNVEHYRYIKPAKLNPWKRRIVPYRGIAVFLGGIENGPKCPFDRYLVNKALDVYTKRAVLKVSLSVVALISYSAGKQAFWGSGVIFASFWDNDSLCYSVLTSGTLLRPPASHACDRPINFIMKERRKRRVEPDDQDYLPIDEKIDVYLKGGNLCEGKIVTYDPHYNIAVLTFKSDKRLPCAVLRPLDDSLASDNAPTNVPYLPVKLVPGDVVVALARFPQKSIDIMAAPGKYSADCIDDNTKLNCMELFRADCKITKCGIGGPVISCAGEVIGISFYAEHYTPFLPINIFFKWWSHHSVTRSHCRPSLGMKVANLHTADLGTLDQVRKLGISGGIIVKKVLSGSPAENCGLRPGDVVFKCSDTLVGGPLQLFESIWDMAGKVVDVVVVREGSYKNMKIEVKDITSADEFYQWLLPRAYVTTSREL
ncbi:hypothetical protein Leryth_021296, partial [Lithospermum erythrorhizon]